MREAWRERQAALGRESLIGKRVTVRGLRSRPELNGQQGVVVRSYSSEGTDGRPSRWAVRLDESFGRLDQNSEVALKEENLAVVESAGAAAE